MRRLLALLVVTGALLPTTVAPASADPGSGNPRVQYRTFTCDDGQTYSGGFIGSASADFFLAGSTHTFAIKIFTEYLPTGPKTFYTGVQGYPDRLITCSYTDPQGVFNIFSGFFTPNA